MKKIAFSLLLCLCVGLDSCSQRDSVPSVVANGPLEYVLEDVSGMVLIQTAGETQANPATDQQTLRAGDEIITQAGAEASLTLNETTLFHVSENSDVKVDQLARNTGTGFVSRLNLVAGRILSEVEKLSETGSTFEVNSGGVICGVRGTSFEVTNQNASVQTATYNGVVAVQKDNNTQSVEAGEHCDYALIQGAFLPKHELTLEEKNRYENWKAKLATVREKCHKRMELLRSLDKMSPAEREKMLQQMNGVNAKDRLKTLQEMMEARQNPTNLQNQAPGSRSQSMEAGSQTGGEMQQRGQGERQGQQQRQQNQRPNAPAAAPQERRRP